MNAIVPSVFGNFSFKGLDHFLGNLRKRHRGTMIILICFVLPKTLNMQAWPIFEGNKRDYPKGASVNCVLMVMHLSCIRLSSG